MLKLLFAVFVLIVAAIAAGTYFQFSTVIPIFIILGFGIRSGPKLLIVAAMIGCGGAAAQDLTKVVNPDAYPAGVQQSLQRARDDCKAAGGGAVTFALDSVRALDLTGDGRDDYIVDFRNAQCQDRAGVYCGSGGCQLDIDVALADGSVRTVFSQWVRSYEVLPGKGARSIRFEMHGGYCGGHGSERCVKTHRVTVKPFGFAMPD